MDKLSLKFINNKKESLEIEEGNSLFKIEFIEGIDSTDVTLNSYNNASYDGIYIASKIIQGRPISIGIDYLGAEKSETRQRLIKFFNLKSNGVLIVKLGDIERAIKYDIEKFSIPLKNIHYKLSFTIDLICQSPYFSDVTETKVDIAQWLGNLKFPLIIPEDTGLVMGYRLPQQFINVINEGDVEVGLSIVFKAVGNYVVNPKLENVVTREYISIDKTLQSGEEITINTRRGEKKATGKYNGVEYNAFNKITNGSTFLSLDVGDNLLMYSAETNQDNLEVTVYYNNAYMGV